jgi:hypothetical protein
LDHPLKKNNETFPFPEPPKKKPLWKLKKILNHTLTNTPFIPLMKGQKKGETLPPPPPPHATQVTIPWKIEKNTQPPTLRNNPIGEGKKIQPFPYNFHL